MTTRRASLDGCLIAILSVDGYLVSGHVMAPLMRSSFSSVMGVRPMPSPVLSQALSRVAADRAPEAIVLVSYLRAGLFYGGHMR